MMKDFYDHGVVTDVCIVRNSRRPTHTEWYPEGTRTVRSGTPEFAATLDAFVRDKDVMVFFETPFRWELIPLCRSLGIKTVLMPMYECSPEDFPQVPDVLINSSDLDQQYYPHGVRLNVPVSAGSWRPRRDRILTFVHNAGHGGLRGRNGTAELITAWPMVDKRAKLILRSQEPLSPAQHRLLERSGNVDIRIGSARRDELYTEGEAFVFPEKFNGLSLPMQEAFAAGMCVIGARRFPMTEWLPKEPLVPVARVIRARVANRFQEFDEAVVEPRDIAAKLNQMFDTDPTPYSIAGREWGKANDWSVLKPQYMSLLQQLVTK